MNMKKKRLWAKRTPGKQPANTCFASHRIVALVSLPLTSPKTIPDTGNCSQPRDRAGFFSTAVSTGNRSL